MNTLPSWVILPSLQVLSFKGNAPQKSAERFSIAKNTFTNGSALEFLDLSNNTIMEVTNGTFHGLKNIREIKLDNTNLTSIQREAFESLQLLQRLSVNNNPFLGRSLEVEGLSGVSLTHLSLENIGLSELDDKVLASRKLMVVKLSRNKIRSVNSFSFNPLTNLKELDLSQNQLNPWDEPILPAGSKLNVLNLASNRLTTVTPAMLQDLAKADLFQLSGNNLTCDCQLTAFAEWLRQTEKELSSKLQVLAEDMSKASVADVSTMDHTFEELSSQLSSLKNLVCASPELLRGTPVVKFHRYCTQFSWKVLATSLAVTVVIFIGLTAILYRYRWYVRYYAFLVKAKRHKALNAARHQGTFQYDAFVSYSNEDSEFVNSLVRTLESPPHNFKLCVYERDFAVGSAITEEIVEAIHKSRRTIMVLSKAFARSQWCKWELHLAQHQLNQEKRDALVIVKLGAIPKELIPAHLSVFLKTNIYLEWEENMVEARETLFWERLKSCLDGSTQITKLLH